MPDTVPNQKIIIIHKDRPQSNFLQISNEHWMEFNKRYGPFALQVYLYLAKNADGFNLALSQTAAEEEAGIKRTTFHKYIDLLIREGYLVQRSGNIYDFYETPQKQKGVWAKPTPHDGKACAWDENENPYDGFGSSPYESDLPSFNREIDKRYTDKKDISKDMAEQKETRGEKTENTKKTRSEFVF